MQPKKNKLDFVKIRSFLFFKGHHQESEKTENSQKYLQIKEDFYVKYISILTTQ